MRIGDVRPSAASIAIVATAVLAVLAAPALAQESKPRMEIYGFAMLDMGYENGATDPDWYDVVRPTKLAAYEDQWGKDGNFYAGVRQSRFGVKGFIPTGLGEMKTIFEFELFGVGPDAGQTTFRLRHAWGELGNWGAGQSWSPFMDIDVFPNSIEYWGPNGMAFFRNVQIRWMPLQGDNQVFVALERPGASGDPGVNSAEIEGLDGRFPLPDLSGHFRMTRKWGHVQAAGILRQIEWDDLEIPEGEADESGSELGWGVNLSTNLKFASNVVRASVVYGEGVQNYMNDATADVGATGDSDIGEALPILGVVAFLDHAWSEKLSSSIGYSMVDIDNSEGQGDDAFKKGQYGLVNLLRTPVPGMMYGVEFQWGNRENFRDGWSVDDYRLQLSFKYNFSMKFGG